MGKKRKCHLSLPQHGTVGKGQFFNIEIEEVVSQCILTQILFHILSLTWLAEVILLVSNVMTELRHLCCD